MEHVSAAARPSVSPRQVSRSIRIATAAVAAAALVLSACGGDDDDDATSSTTTVPVEIAPTSPPTTLPPATTLPPPTTLPPLDLVTEGAVVIVANASGVDGAAGRLTDRLESVGFSTSDATNSAESFEQLSTSQILHVADDAAAEAVAQSLRDAFGGGDITVEPATLPVPTESGELGEATVLVLMGNDIADKSLEELQGRVATSDATDEEDEATTDGTADTAEEATTESEDG